MPIHLNGTTQNPLHWYKDAIIYELHIKAFCDGNGDGIGDFEGLLTKLDYLQELGVTAIWLLPFYPSPLRDDGYDIADYYAINPTYGTIEQFKTLLHEAHQRHLKVITELVINHTSDQHPWFQRARHAPKGSPERDYYVWTDDASQYADVRIIFQDFERSNWTWDAEAQQYYWHRFFHHQPDLNYDNPQVQAEVIKLIDYWCALGVDGFRLDAVPYLFEREGTNGENLPETHAFLKTLRAHIDAQYPNVVLLAEANMWPEDSALYFGDGDECHMNYHFPVMPRMFMALQMEDRYPIVDIFDQTPTIPDGCQWAIFLRNHDELTLEMVTDEERDYMYSTYAKEPKAKINLGIRRRLAPLLDNNRKKIELLNSLLFSLAGTPVLYYGDEIGMGDNVYLGDRDGVRTPMQWSPDRNAGFSVANPQKLYLPTILDPEYHFESVNVETQRRNTSSLFWFMKRMINLRRNHKAFGRGDMRFLSVDNPKVLAFTRTYAEETLLIVVNLSKYAQPTEVRLPGHAGNIPIELFSKNAFPAVSDDETYFFTLAPHDYQWFALQKITVDTIQDVRLPVMQIEAWADLMTNGNRATLETSVLPDYLLRTHWLPDQKQPVQEIKILNHTRLPLPDAELSVYLVLLEVTYAQGLPDRFQLTLAFANEEQAAKLSQTCPQAILATLLVGEQPGMLCDGLYVPTIQQALFLQLTNGDSAPIGNETDTLKNGATISRMFQRKPVLSHYRVEHKPVKSRLLHTGADYLSIGYDNQFLLKLYRKVDFIANPDAELTHFLTEIAHFNHVPGHVGTLSMMSAYGPVLLGVVENLVAPYGNGKQYVLERVNNYIERVLARSQPQLDTALNSPRGTLSQPVAFDDLPEETQELLGRRAAGQAHSLGIRIGEMHRALSSSTNLADFAPEPFSLHYQRSLFSGMQSLVRETYQQFQQHPLPPDGQPLADTLLDRQHTVLDAFRRIYNHKIDSLKIRIHGDLQLEKILLTGRDLAIRDFGGDPFRPFSERRLKRSPLRDVAAMIRSFYHVADEGFATSDQISPETAAQLRPYAPIWAWYMSGFFTRAWLDTVQPGPLVPAAPDDLQMMLETYLLEKAMIDLNHDLSRHPDRALVSLELITSLLSAAEPSVSQLIAELEAM